jgi:hypothetical protein
VKSKRLSDFLEALSDERLPARAKFGSLLDVWRAAPRPADTAFDPAERGVPRARRQHAAKLVAEVAMRMKAGER